MANKNLLKSKAVLKAISIGLAAMMAMTPVVGATDVYADDVDGNEGESNKSNISESQSESSENNTQSSENNTQAVEDSYEQAKKELVPEIPQDATVTTDTTDGVTTEKTKFTETSENVKTDITVEKTTSEDGNSEDIKVTTDETTTESENQTEYTYNNETVIVTKEEYAQKIEDSKAGKDQDGKDLVFSKSAPSDEDVLDELGNKIGVKTTVTEVATFIDKDGYETTKTITTTVIKYNDSEITAPNALAPAAPDTIISLGEATDNSSSTAVLPDGTIIIETSEKKASAYKSEKSESKASTTVNNKVSEETVEIKSTGKKTETISSFDSKDEAYKMLDILEDKDKESVSVVQNDDGTYKLVKTVYVEVDEPEDITVNSGDGVTEFDNLVKDKYSKNDGWDIVMSKTDEVSGTTTWTVTKTNKEDVTIKYTYKFTPEKRNETSSESPITTLAKTADEFAKNHLSEYTAENSGWDVLEKTDGNTTIWTISKKDKDSGTTTQYTYKFTATESTSTATKASVTTKATTNKEFLDELNAKYKDNGSVTITDNNNGTYTVVSKGSNPNETLTEIYSFSSSEVVDIPKVTAATWDEFVNAFEENKNASIDELNKKCTVTTKSEAGTTIITYTFSEGKPVTSEVETVTTTSLNASDFEAELREQFAGWEFSDIDTKSKPGYAVWTVSKSENGTKTEYEYSFKYESEDAKPYTPTAKDEKSFKSELIANYGKANVSISSKKVDGVTTTTYTCTKEVDGLTQTYVYTSKTVAEKADEFYTTATSVDEFKKLISEKYPGYNFVHDDEKIHDNKGNAADKCTCTVTKDGKTVAIYEYWVSPDSGHNSKEEKLKDKTIEEYLKEKYPTDNGWTIESIGDNKWKASKPQNDNHTYVQIITLNGATPDEFTKEEISAWEKDIYNNHKESEGWTVTKDGNNNKWVAVKKFGKVTVDEVVYELTENGTTKSVTRKVEKSTLSEILGDEVFSENAPAVNASNYQAYTLISAGDAIIGDHENGGVYAGGQIGTKNSDGTFNKDGEVNIDDWFGAVLYDYDGVVNLQNCDNQNRIERKKVDKNSDKIKEYWSGVADSVIKSCDLAAEKIIAGVYKVKDQIVANYDEWLEKPTIDLGDNPFYNFMEALNKCNALLTAKYNQFQPAQDGSGETGNSNLVIVSRKSDKITVSNWLGNLNLGLLLAPNADIEVEGNNFTGTLIGNNIVNNAQSHTNIRGEKITEKETKKVGKSVTVEHYKVNAKQKLAEMICTLSDPKVVANRVKTEATVDAKGHTFSASMESFNVNASSKTDTITDIKLEKAKEGIKKEKLGFEKNYEKSSSEKFGSKVTSKTTITNKKSVVILGKKVSETGTRVVTPPPTTPPVTPPPTTPPTTPPPTTPPVTPPSITPPTPVTPDTPTEGVLGARREVSPDAAVLGARRRVLGARRGVLGEKRVLGARTEDTSNAAGAVGVMLGSVALSGVWMTLRRKKKIQ